MNARRLSPKAALIVFVIMFVFVLMMATWWIIFMARLTDEKVDIAHELGADPEYLEELHKQEISRQIMLGSEGVVFLLLVLIGVWHIYRALVQTERLRRHQENFLMSVTHELKTPLASLGVYLDTIQSPKIAADKKLAVLPRMKQDLGRLGRLVEDILEASRFDVSVYKPQLQRIDLAGLLNVAVENLERDNPGRQLRLTRRIAPDIYVQADKAAITRALGAILDNAVKYAGPGEPDLTVSLQRRDRIAEIVVADRGVGIDKKELLTIFDRFYRIGSELTRSSGGTGLGLYLCREMIRAHGGTVIARSEGAGLGTEFVITLPLDKEP